MCYLFTIHCIGDKVIIWRVTILVTKRIKLMYYQLIITTMYNGLVVDHTFTYGVPITTTFALSL